MSRARSLAWWVVATAGYIGMTYLAVLPYLEGGI